MEAVKEEFDDFGGTHGSPKIWIRLVRQGWRGSVNTIAKIMSEPGRAEGVQTAGADPAGQTARPPRTSCAGTSPQRHLTWSGGGGRDEDRRR
ncbi:IS3 family transposase [Streptomyces fodineus]|uniref:IS3 family transposase n=1 Tax=Streptomyces fodineus TaxID=1904616 RepID=UPI000D1A52C1